MRGNAVPANYIKRHGVLLVRASRPTTLTLCARLKATRLWSYGAEFSLVVGKNKVAMKSEENFQFERARGIVWVCDIANSTKLLNDNKTAGLIEEFLPR